MGREPVIYAHRGLWSSPDKQNSIVAITKAAEHGFGIETDFRSKNKKLIISHDPANDSEIKWAADFDFKKSPVAMNVKEDGLAPQFADFIKENQNEHSFLFDASIPEMVKIRNQGLPHALRLSEYEKDLPWETSFIWIDGFISDWWIDSKEVEENIGKSFLVFVSPELHGRNRRSAWEYFRRIRQINVGHFGVCTDFPIELKDFLNE